MQNLDVEPMHIDKSISFENIGGLDHHIASLKEMIVFPILYPEFFTSLKIDPPRGVLFFGPPGTGKTLCARALANECSRHGKHVSFFMRKGADCVSKWIGESERMLRLLFDQAYRLRPSIIFFDEIDGLAPVRIHVSLDSCCVLHVPIIARRLLMVIPTVPAHPTHCGHDFPNCRCVHRVWIRIIPRLCRRFLR
jgi:ATP-dependent 26S proteasome regulatory subunit